MAENHKNKITITLIHGIPTLWNEEDCDFIRKNRIIGTRIGPLPKFSVEKNQFGLPMRLMNEEAKLLFDKNFVDAIVEFTLGDIMTSSEHLHERRKERRDAINETQSQLAFEERKSEILRVAEKILEGRKKKLKSSAAVSGTEDTLTVEQVIAEEIEKISGKGVSKFVELCIEHPYFSELPLKKIDWAYPDSEVDKLRYFVYKDLWERGFYLTSGIKFGGDYLVYHNDPDTFHASFIVKCMNDNEKLNPCDIVASTRVGTVTKKTFVIASIDDNKVCYQSFQWTGLDLTLP